MPQKTSSGGKKKQPPANVEDGTGDSIVDPGIMDLNQLRQSNAALLQRVDHLSALITRSMPDINLPSTSTANLGLVNAGCETGQNISVSHTDTTQTDPHNTTGHGHNTRGASRGKNQPTASKSQHKGKSADPPIQHRDKSTDPPPPKRGRPAKKAPETVTSSSVMGDEDVLEFAKSTGTDPVDWERVDVRGGDLQDMDRVRARQPYVRNDQREEQMDFSHDFSRQQRSSHMDHPRDDFRDHRDEDGVQDNDVYNRRSIRIDERNISGSIENALRDRFSGSDCLSNVLISGLTIDVKVKQLIWHDQYIDLMSLDNNSDQNSSQSQGGTPSNHKPKKVPNFSEWSRLFHIYCSIYVIKHPESASELFSYVNLIQSLSNRRPISYLWRSYDEHFRKLRSLAPTLPWHVRHQQVISLAEDDLNLEASRSNFRAKTRPTINTNNTNNVKQTKSNVCYDYNNIGKFCTRSNCPYQHKCAKCSLNHPAHMCRKDNATQPSKPQPPSKK